MNPIKINYPELWQHIFEMKMIDCHNHLQTSAEYAKGQIQPLYSDEAGLDAIMQSVENFSHSEGAFRQEGLRVLCRKYAGTEIISRENLAMVRDVLQKRYYKLGGVEQMLDDANIAFVLNDPCGITIQEGFPTSRMNFKIRMDFFTDICSFEDILVIEEFAGFKIHSLNDLMDAAEKMIVEARKQGATVIKNVQAYFRDLRYINRTHHEAETDLHKILSETRFSGWGKYIRYSPEHMRGLNDFMVHYFCRLALKYDMTLGFHTGPSFHFTSGPRSLTELSGLLLQYPDVRFNLMHGSLPYYQEAAYIASRMPNVSIDLSWCHNLGSAVSLEALYYWLGFAPINRISGYGTDNMQIETIWWCSQLARKTTYQALARHIDEGRFTEDDATKIATMILYENPARIFKLNQESVR